MSIRTKAQKLLAQMENFTEEVKALDNVFNQGDYGDYIGIETPFGWFKGALEDVICATEEEEEEDIAPVLHIQY